MVATAAEGYGADYFAIACHGYSTSHLDALCHVFHEGRTFNGFPAEIVTAHGATRFAIDQVRTGIATRGVLLDIAAVRGVEALEPGERIIIHDLEAAEKASGLTVRTGDALLVRTGRWRWRELHGPWDPTNALAGLDASCLAWPHDREIAILGCDGVSDVFPSRVSGFPLPVHPVAIVAMGVHLLNNLDLEDVARTCIDESRWEFLLTVAPLVLNCGTESPVNPICLFLGCRAA
jgi:kynurenine formamidase